MITFRDFMEQVLYDPQSGYYGATRKILADFYTAPEVHASFGIVLADDIAARLGRLQADGEPGPYTIVEMGSGDGTLAQAVLERLRDRHPALFGRVEYRLVERSEKFLSASFDKLKSFGGKVSGALELGTLTGVRGVFFSNELVDAFPVHLLEKRGGKVREVYVSTPGASTPLSTSDAVRVELGEVSRPELAEHAARMLDHMEEGDRHAVNLEAARWVGDVAQRLAAGWLITIDYGKRYPEGAVTPPRVFYRHRLEDFPSRPGLEDITASVDFETLIQSGERSGFATETYTTMSRYLLDRGILDHLPAADNMEAQKERLKIKTLFHPDGMGEKYKVLVQRKGGAGFQVPGKDVSYETTDLPRNPAPGTASRQ